MITFSLNTFIKVCLLDTGGRISEIQKKLDPGSGYDFYHSFQRASKLSFSGEDIEEINEVLDAPVKKVERDYNRAAFEKVKSKFGKQKNIEILEAKTSLKFPKFDVEISVDPLLSFEKSGSIQTLSFWLSQKPELTQRYAAVACYLMREAYKDSPLANSNFFYHDTIKGKTYSEKQITANTSLILEADLSVISKMLKEL